MAKVQDVALFFIDLAKQKNDAECGDLMTNLRLQKLLFFAQGWHLARYGKPLFDAPIEAWRLGPVVPEVYRTYKKHGNFGIADECAPPSDAFTPEEYELLLDVAREYDMKSTSSLIYESHEPGAPWSLTKPSEVIPMSAIQAFYSSKHLPSFDDILDGYPIEVI